MTYTFYSDGAATMRQVNGEYVREAGGWAWALINDNEEIIISEAGGAVSTTNNEMELMAIYKVLEYYKYNKIKIGDTIIICSDSSYCINIFTNWINGWIAKGWSRGKGKPIENLKLIKDIYNLIEEFKSCFIEVRFTKVKGHNVDKFNNYVDSLAVNAKKSFAKVKEDSPFLDTQDLLSKIKR